MKSSLMDRFETRHPGSPSLPYKDDDQPTLFPLKLLLMFLGRQTKLKASDILHSLLDSLASCDEVG